MMGGYINPNPGFVILNLEIGWNTCIKKVKNDRNQELYGVKCEIKMCGYVKIMCEIIHSNALFAI